jgi:broad specificity phosphatase PhoE
MSVLTLVRHGQARAFQRESDLLTQAGEEQARRLAAFWLKNACRFDEVYTGTLERQRATERIIGAVIPDWPPAVVMPEFDEYDATGVLNRLVPELASREARFAELVRAFEEARDNRTFQRMFEIAMNAWLSGANQLEGVESFTSFRDRVGAGLNRITGAAGSRRVAVFTSGGPIGLAVQTAMEAPDRQFLEVNWRVRNCSLTEFLFSAGRVTLDSFNSIPHLSDANLATYR